MCFCEPAWFQHSSSHNCKLGHQGIETILTKEELFIAYDIEF